MANEGSLVVAVGSKIGEVLIAQIGRQLGFLTHYKSNIENLMKQVENLKDKRTGLQQLVDAAIKNGDIIGDDVQRWLTNVDELCVNATGFYEGEVKENNGCLKGWCPNLKVCYTLSKKAKKKTEEALGLRKEVFDRISYPGAPLAIGFTSVAEFKRFESRVPTIKDIMKHLKGDEVSIIGICGMGGVGKTTMVEEIARRVRDEKLFDGIAMAVVSQNGDTMKIQDEIAFHLGMKFEEKNSLSVRANCLCKRLMQSGKGNLVILDDMWGSFDLKEIGIPYGGVHKRCKIVLTSRIEDVCKVMKCEKIFQIEVLSEKEAWSLFREMVGDYVDAPDLYLTASKVAEECGGLPIAVITLGKALNDKSKEVWDDALIQLRKSFVPTTLSEVEPKLHRSLKLSYDHLDNKEAKSLFLLCCLFPEDSSISLEDLVRYGVGLRLFEGTDLLTQTRDRVLALTMKLKSCFLLLASNKKFHVKLHDVVRDVGITIASKDNRFNMKLIHGGEWPKVRDDAYRDCNALSVISDKIKDFPSEGMDCPNLEVLQLACRDFSLEALNSRNVFEGMPRLTVLDMWGMNIQSLPLSVQLLKQLRVLQFENVNRFIKFFDISKELGNLEILSIGYLPENIGWLTNLRLLDLRSCGNEMIIPPSVFSCLHALEDLHTGNWKPAEGGDKSGNACFSDLESLSNLTSLVIKVPHARFLPINPFLKKLKRYVLVVGVTDFRRKYFSKNSENCFLEKSLSLTAYSIDDGLLGGGIDHLLKQSTETLSLVGDGLKLVLDQLFPGGSTHLRILYISQCNAGVEYLVDTGRAELVPPNIGVFAKLEKLILESVTDIKEICHGQQLPVGSFRSLKKMDLSDLPALTHLWEYRNQNVNLSNLRLVWVSKCNKLKNLFTLSVARSLVNLESLYIGESKTMEEVFVNQGASATVGVELADIQKIEFPKLNKLLLMNLGSLTCFSKGINQIILPQLTDLCISGLPKLRSLCGNSNVALEDNRTVQLQPLLNKVKLTNLKNLRIFQSLDNLTEIWNDQLDRDSFHELKRVEIFQCNRISSVLRCNMTQGFQNLEELNVRDCRLVEYVFEYGELNNVSEEGHDAVKLLPRLKELDLRSLPKLTQLWKKHIRMNQDFQELSFIHIARCHSMKLVFSSSIAKVLVKLQKLSIVDCKMVEQIVVNDHPAEGEASEHSGMMEFQSLMSLSLKCLPNLTSVYSGWLSFPSLVKLKLARCSKMKMFSLSSFRDTGIKNPPLFSDQVTFPILKELRLRYLPNIEELCCSQIPTGSFQKLRVLEVVGCDKLVNIIPSHLRKVFSSLEELKVSECDSLEELFDSKGASFGGGYHATLTETLRSITVKECHHIRNLFPSSIARCLVNLQKLKVESCPEIEDFFMEKADKDGGEDTLFPALEILELSNLPRLKSFFSVNYAIQLQVLTQVAIYGCSEMATFSSSFVSTPKLDGVWHRQWVAKSIWKGDVNRTIEHIFGGKDTQEQETEDDSDEMDVSSNEIEDVLDVIEDDSKRD